MFSNLFNYDNPVWRFIGKFWDVLVVNLLWIICSIPIVTIGASTTAMYYVTLRLVRDEDGYTIRSFFKSFKDNFKQATAIWLIFLAVGLILGFDLYFVLTMMAYSTLRTVMTTVFLALLFIWFAMFTFVFPLQSRFYNPVKKTIFNAFFMSIRHIFYTIGIVVMDVVLVLLTLTMIPQLLMCVEDGVFLLEQLRRGLAAGIGSFRAGLAARSGAQQQAQAEGKGGCTFDIHL